MKTLTDFGIDLGGRSGDEVQTICPRCSHTRRKAKVRCLSVNTVEGIWNCHHCGWAGSLRQGEQSKARFVVKPSYQPSNEIPGELTEFFKSRGIGRDLFRTLGIGLQTAYLPQFEEEVPCIAFPYYRRGEVVNIKFRGLTQKAFRQVGHAEKILFNLDALAGATEAIIVEGEIDAISILQTGYTAVVSVPDGAPPAGSKPSEVKFEYLVNCEADLAPLTKIILAVDNDPAGKTLEEELARRLGPERCFRVTWPSGCKDANEVLLREGLEALRVCIGQAKPVPLEGVITVTDVAADVIQLYREGLPGGLSTGWACVDRHYTVRPGELTIVTGIPSHGKSQVLDALAVNLAREHDWSIGVCSPENLPVSRHLAKLAEQYSGRPFRQGPTSRLPQDELVSTLEWLEQHFVFIAPEESLNIVALLKISKSLVARRGIRGLIIDPWNEFDHSRSNNQSETEYISVALTHIRRFARAHGVHVWLVAHPQKLYRLKDGSYPIPTPYDISGSAHWRNKADNCLTVWRDQNDPEQPVKLYVQKVRFREVGSIGEIHLRWNRLNGRYSEWNSSTPSRRDYGYHEANA
jgi:twinkle protein